MADPRATPEAGPGSASHGPLQAAAPAAAAFQGGLSEIDALDAVMAGGIDTHAQTQQQLSNWAYLLNRDGPWVPSSLGTRNAPNTHVSFAPEVTQYRSNALSVSSAVHHHGALPSDSGYVSFPRQSVGALSVYGDGTDTLSLVGHMDGFSFHPADTSSAGVFDQFRARRPWSHAGDLRPSRSLAPTATDSLLTCRHCQHTCKTRSELKKHEQRHTKPNVCREPGCNRKGFSTLNDLDRHTRSRHPNIHSTGQRFKCHLDICRNKNKIWPRADNFRQHLKRIHRKESIEIDLGPFVFRESQPFAQHSIDENSVYHDQPDLEMSEVGTDLVGTQQPDWNAHTQGPDVTSEMEGLPTTVQLSHIENGFHPDASLLVGGQFSDFSHSPVDSQDQQQFRSNSTSMAQPGHVGLHMSQIMPQNFLGLPAEPISSQNSRYHQDPLPSPVEYVFGASQASVHSPLETKPDIIVDSAETSDDSTEAESPCDVDTHGPGDDVFKSRGSSIGNPNDVDAHDGTSTPLATSITTISEPSALGATSVAAVLAPRGFFGENITPGSSSSGTAAGVEDGVLHERNLMDDDALRESLKSGHLDKLLREYGYGKIKTNSSPAPKPLKTSTRIKTDGTPSTEPPSLVRCDVEGCFKIFNRECELRKHRKRHSKPYGCTFPHCSKKFGSKSDWKRHENSQHQQADGWRCDMLVTVTDASLGKERQQVCGKQCHRRETFRGHLTKDHGLHGSREAEDAIAEKLESCRYGKDCDARFWCGFCVAVVEVAKRNSRDEGGGPAGNGGGWTERYDHIDDHFCGRHFPKQSIDEWQPDDGSAALSTISTGGMAMGVSSTTPRSLHPSAYDKRSGGGDEHQVSPERRRNKRPKGANSSWRSVLWVCCECKNYNQCQTTTRCFGVYGNSCDHHQCVACETRVTTIVENDKAEAVQ